MNRGRSKLPRMRSVELLGNEPPYTVCRNGYGRLLRSRIFSLFAIVLCRMPLLVKLPYRTSK